MATTKNNGRGKVARGNVVVADAVGGVVIVPAAAGRQIIVTDCWVRALGGATTNCTAIEIQGTGGTVVAVSVAAAAATQNTICRPETASVTATNLNQSAGAGAIPAGEGLRLISTGTVESTASSFDYHVEYITVAA